MFDITTIPPREVMLAARDEALDYMRPNALPTAVVVKGFLTPDNCREIADTYNSVEPYAFHGCNATTRECERPLHHSLYSMVSCAEMINALYWQFDLDPQPAAWMQTYGPGDSYQVHADAAPGQMRKLTAVAFLSESSSYNGGHLRVHTNSSKSFPIPRTQGSIVVFPSWVPHFVDVVEAGTRQTINLGFWGPNFR